LMSRTSGLTQKLDWAEQVLFVETHFQNYSKTGQTVQKNSEMDL